MRRNPPTPQWSRIPESLADKEKIALLQQRLNDVLKWIDEVANLPAMKDYLPVALTAQDTQTVDSTYGDEERDVINNNRARIAELEARFAGFGLSP